MPDQTDHETELRQRVCRHARREEMKDVARMLLAFALLAGALQILLFGFEGLVPLYFKFVEGVGL